MNRWLIAVAAIVTFGLALAPPLAAAKAVPIETFFGTFNSPLTKSSLDEVGMV